MYTRLSSAEVRHQLIELKGYGDEELPTVETIRQRLNQLGYGLKRVAKTKPLKQIPETEAIFESVNRINKSADDDPTKNSDIWVKPFNQSIFERRDISVDEGLTQMSGFVVTPTTLRISIDAKVAVKVGEFDRGGKTRIKTVALDHDFPSAASLTPDEKLRHFDRPLKPFHCWEARH